MLDQVHAGDCVHGLIRPAEFLVLQIGSLEFAPRWILRRLACHVGGIEAQVRAQLGDVSQRFPI
jgi:hypothetical protein